MGCIENPIVSNKDRIREILLRVVDVFAKFSLYLFGFDITILVSVLTSGYCLKMSAACII